MLTASYLNYHHLRHFYNIARTGSMSEAARRLNIAQSALSTQIKEFESNLGQKLFDRKGRKLELTEAGLVAFEYAEDIFGRGEEMLAWFGNNDKGSHRGIRLGALSPVSKILQYEVILPIVMESRTKVSVIEGEMDALLEKLNRHELDMVISNVTPDHEKNTGTTSHLLGRMPVYLVGRPPFRIHEKSYPKWLADVPLFLPSVRTSARQDFDALMERYGIEPRIAAEVDDAALLRLLALSGGGLSLVPEISVRFEIEEKRLLKIKKMPDVHEQFFALTARRKRMPIAVTNLIDIAQKSLAKKEPRSAIR
ncbi:MAG: LysR family transcriptional regulator [Opitutales bacterium]